MGFLKLFADKRENSDNEMVLPADASAYVSSEYGELIAVISAAIAAFEGDAHADGLIVRRIHRISDQMPAWNRAGLSECIDSRKM